MSSLSPAAVVASATAEDFFAQLRQHNPFIDNRINAPSADDVDVEELHRPAFERLAALAGEALAARRGLGAVLWGQAGIGKSHLLSRLGRWAAGRACLVYLHNLQASPANLPRALLRAVTGWLTHGEGTGLHNTLLVRMIHGVLQDAVGVGVVKPWSALKRALQEALEQQGLTVSGDAGLADRTVIDVLFRFYRSVHRTGQGKEDGSTARAAVQWLRGDALTPEQGQLLDLPPARRPEDGIALEDDQQIKQVLVAFTALAACRRQPFVLCFDQVDNLDTEQFAALARFLEALIDSSRNLLVVTAGIQESLLHWREQRVIQDSAWDRLVQFPIALHRLPPEQARPLIQKRVERFLAPFEELPEVREKVFEDLLFPLGSRWYEEQMKERVEVRPRDVISEAGGRWYLEQQALEDLGGDLWLSSWKDRQEGKAIKRPVTPEQRRQAIDQAIEDRMAEYRKAAGGVLPHKDSLSESVAQLLEQCQRLGGYGLLEVIRLEKSKSGKVPVYDVVVRQQAGAGGGEIQTGLVFVPASGARGMFHVLDRLRDDSTPPQRALLIADEGGLDLGSKGEEYMEELRQRRGFLLKVVQLPISDFTALDALHAVWNEARGDDLEALLPNGETHRVSAAEVEESHHRRGHYHSAPLLAELFAVPEPEPVVPELELPVAEPVFAEEVEELTIAEAVVPPPEDDVVTLDDDVIDLE
jgi:hypothetical protein